jgi:hypothetical protein
MNRFESISITEDQRHGERCISSVRKAYHRLMVLRDDSLSIFDMTAEMRRYMAKSWVISLQRIPATNQNA